MSTVRASYIYGSSQEKKQGEIAFKSSQVNFFKPEAKVC